MFKLTKCLVGLLTSVLLTSCGHKLVKDPHAQAVDSRYYNVEFSINDTKARGGDVLLVDKSSSPSDYKLAIYGPDRGVIYLASKRCGVDKSVTYSRGKHAAFSLGDLFSSFKNCMLEITVTPSYDEWKHDQVSVSPHQGVLYLRVLPDNSNHIMKVKPSNFLQFKDNTSMSPLVESTPGVKFAAFHCSDNSPKVVLVGDDGIVTLDSNGLRRPDSGCLVQLKDKNGGFSAVMLNVYDKKYQPLAEPTVEVKGGSLHIRGSTYVNLTDVNGEAFHGNKAKVKYASGITYVIRQYTTKGRGTVTIFKGD